MKPRESDTVTAGEFFVLHLERLVRLLREYADPQKPSVNALGVRLLQRAITATYFDADDQGAGVQARALMGHLLPGWTPYEDV